MKREQIIAKWADDIKYQFDVLDNGHASILVFEKDRDLFEQLLSTEPEPMEEWFNITNHGNFGRWLKRTHSTIHKNIYQGHGHKFTDTNLSKLVNEYIRSIPSHPKPVDEPDNTTVGMSAEEFRKIWMQQNPNVVHIPSQHEAQLMKDYAAYASSATLNYFADTNNQQTEGKGMTDGISILIEHDRACDGNTDNEALSVIAETTVNHFRELFSQPDKSEFLKGIEYAIRHFNIEDGEALIKKAENFKGAQEKDVDFDEIMEELKTILAEPEPTKQMSQEDYDKLNQPYYDKDGVQIKVGDTVYVDNDEYDVKTKCVIQDGSMNLLAEDDGHWTRQLYHQPERLKIDNSRGSE